jgi:hypothetical protein
VERARARRAKLKPGKIRARRHGRRTFPRYYLDMRLFALLVLPVCLSCLEQLPEHIALQPAAEQVDFATEAPNRDVFMLIGEVTGEAAGEDADAAEEAARNDLRNKAAFMGATLVTIDENIGENMPLQDKIKVKLIGRAYKSVD